MLQINDIKYEANYEATKSIKKLDIGKQVGEITYTMSDKACSGHKMKNGHAAFLTIGTPVYMLNGYKSTYRVVADNKIYEVNTNNKTKYVSDLYDIKNKVQKISIESDYDSSHVSDFSQNATSQFTKEFLKLKLLREKQIEKYAKNLQDSDRIFLRVHLLDGSSFRIIYWTESNITSPWAFGNDTLKNIILSQK